MRVDVGDGATMPKPDSNLEWHMRYGDAVGRRFAAAEVVAAYNYLIWRCTKDEIWRRVKLIRAASKGGQ
jgi:hypothetical protein